MTRKRQVQNRLDEHDYCVLFCNYTYVARVSLTKSTHEEVGL